MSATIELTDFGEAQRQLAVLHDKMLEGGKEALNEAADFMVITSRTLCPVDTGTLQSSIRKIPGWTGGVYRYSITVIAGGAGFINPKTNGPCNYAAIQERRVGYMRGGWESIRGFITGLIREKVLFKIE